MTMRERPCSPPDLYECAKFEILIRRNRRRRDVAPRSFLRANAKRERKKREDVTTKNWRFLVISSRNEFLRCPSSFCIIDSPIVRAATSPTPSASLPLHPTLSKRSWPFSSRREFFSCVYSFRIIYSPLPAPLLRVTDAY